MQVVTQEDIGYTSDVPAMYSKEIDSADTLERLVQATARWRLVASDAHDAAAKMGEAEFLLFRRGLRKERRGVYAGDEWCERFGDIIMPAVMLKVGVLAHKVHVPWGCAWNRLKEVGRVEIIDGVASWREPEPRV